MNNQTLRIIGGQWRSRKLNFPDIKGLRPTPDRIRETLFNWLAPTIHGAACLDLFAGSGALGFEAISRGASTVVMVDAVTTVINSLKTNAAQLNATNINIYQAKIPTEFFKIPQQLFNIIFLDPPFQQQLLEPCCQWLEDHNYLAKDALIYLEMESKLAQLNLPNNWCILKDKKAGQVRYCLATRQN